MTNENGLSDTHSRTVLIDGFAYYLGTYSGAPLVIRTSNNDVYITGRDCELLGPVIKVERSESKLMDPVTIAPETERLTVGGQEVSLRAYEGPQLAIRLQDQHILFTSRDCEILGVVMEDTGTVQKS